MIIYYNDKFTGGRAESHRLLADALTVHTGDAEKAKKIIFDILASHELVLSDPEPFVRLSAHSKSAIEITTRAWAKTEDYWTVYFDVLETVKTKFDEAGIEIPFDQLDVHIRNEK